MSVVIVDYGSGNLHSAKKAFEKAASGLRQPPQVIVTSDPKLIANADRVVLPGVGAFADCKKGLVESPGLVDGLEEAVHRKGKPFLGICVGMQLMAQRGLEHGIHEGLAWLKGEVRAITPKDPTLKIPHMGWNTLELRKQHALLKDIPLGPAGLHAYFVHSFHFVPTDPGDVIAVTDYGGPLVAIVGKDNIAGTQFHPEKSQKLGLALIENFLRWTP